MRSALDGDLISFAYHDLGGKAEFMAEVEFKLERVHVVSERFKLRLNAGAARGWNWSWSFSTMLRGWIGRRWSGLPGITQNLLAAAVANPETGGFAKLPLLSENDRRQLLVEWNATAAEFPADEMSA